MKNYVRIKDLKVDETISQIFMIAEIEQKTTKQGKAYGRLLVRDKDGQMTINVWDFSPREYPEVHKGGFVSMKVEVEDFKGSKQGVSTGVPMPVQTPTDMGEYCDSRGLTPEQAQAYYDDLMSFRKLVQNPYIKAYLETIFSNPEIEKLYKVAPASASNRGAYIGGLVEHVSKVMHNADMIVQSQLRAHNPPPINVDMVIAGVLTHDLGKLYAYIADHTGASTTRSGKLIGHLPLSYSISVQSFIQTESNIREPIPETIKDHINHIILAHHGRLDYGSPITPMSIEAQIVHQADVADSVTSNFAEPLVDHRGDMNNENFVEGNRFSSKQIFVDTHGT